MEGGAGQESRVRRKREREVRKREEEIKKREGLGKEERQEVLRFKIISHLQLV